MEYSFKSVIKRAAFVLSLCSSLFVSALATADEKPDADGEIPTSEKEFISAINGFDKSQIIAQFGEPSSADDVKINGSSKVVSSIWQYHFINTAVDGSYYQTTELDFIDDKVVMVVFMNHDGTEKDMPGQQYEVQGQQKEPSK